jgi:hypothetical protein
MKVGITLPHGGGKTDQGRLIADPDKWWRTQELNLTRRPKCASPSNYDHEPSTCRPDPASCPDGQLTFMFAQPGEPPIHG